MTKPVVVRFCAVAALTLSSFAWAASPSVKDVYTAVRAGRVAEAETMMQQVLAEHPQSAEAHYVDAEVEYRAGHLDQARAELATAERINPALPFASPHSVAELKAGLANAGRVRSGSSAYAGGGGSHFPWGLFLGIVAIVLLVVMLMRRRQQTVVMTPGYGQPGYGPGAPMGGGPAPMGGPGYGYGYGPGVMGQGSGLMGNVASGLAVGAGIVAGEELARRVFEPGHPNYVPPSQDTYVDPNADMGGDNFGVSDSGSDWGDGGGFSGGGGGDDWS